MAITQENVAQPPPPNQPDQAAGTRSDTQVGAYSSSPAQPPVAQSPRDPAAGPRAQSADRGFSPILQQQISQAIQPVLDGFRQQLAQEMAHQTAGEHGGGSAGQASAPTSSQPSGPQSPAQLPPTQYPATGHTPASLPQQSPPSAPANEARTQAPPQAPPVDQHVAEGPVSGVVAPVAQVVEQHGAHWLQSLLVAGLAALLSETTRTAVQLHAEQGLHTLLHKLFDAAPDGVMTPEMQGKLERTLQLILRESLDAVFADGVRTSVQQGGQKTAQQSLRGDFRAALGNVEGTLKVMVDALIIVLRRHQQTVLRLLLALVLLALENSLVQPEKAK